MGIELRLLFPIFPESDAYHDMIDLWKNYDLFDQIEKLPKKDISGPIWCFLSRSEDGESCYGKVENDPYGGRIKIVMMSELLKLSDHHSVTGSWRSRAAWAYMAQFPQDWPVALYWH